MDRNVLTGFVMAAVAMLVALAAFTLYCLCALRQPGSEQGPAGDQAADHPEALDEANEAPDNCGHSEYAI
jgi:cytochrome c-type biogenesis protein CcmH/NrfG